MIARMTEFGATSARQTRSRSDRSGASTVPSAAIHADIRHLVCAVRCGVSVDPRCLLSGILCGENKSGM